MKYQKIINLDINMQLYNPIQAKQGDTARYLLFKILDNGVPFSLVNRNVRSYAVKPDGNKIFNNLSIIDAEGGLAELLLTEQMLAVPGWLNMELVIYESQDILSTSKFTIDIIAGLRDDAAIESANEFNALNEAFIIVDQYGRELKDATGKMELKYAIELNDLSTVLSETTSEVNKYIPQLKSFCTFADAYTKWLKGDKFPIAFYGDSTVDGDNTTGNIKNVLGKDIVSPNAYCKKLEDMIRKETGNNTMRIYNAGFSGMDLNYGIGHFNDEFGEGKIFGDTKMLGIGFAINDRLKYSTLEEYKKGIYDKTETLILMCFERGIQPFICTPQVTIEPNVSTEYIDKYPLKSSNAVSICANEIKKELAKKYNLEIVDFHKITEDLIMNSKYPLKLLISDQLHYGDIGHKYEAGAIFASIVPRVTYIYGEERIINYSTPRLNNAVEQEKLLYCQDKFKCYADHSKSTSTDSMIMSCNVFITKNETTLTAFKSRADSKTYVTINGERYPLTGFETKLKNLDIGMYRIEVMTDLSVMVDFKGFVFNNKSEANGFLYKSSGCSVTAYENVLTMNSATTTYNLAVIKNLNNAAINSIIFDTRNIYLQDTKVIWVIVGCDFNNNFTVLSFSDNLNKQVVAYEMVDGVLTTLDLPQLKNFITDRYFSVETTSTTVKLTNMANGTSVTQVMPDNAISFKLRPNIGIMVNDSMLPTSVKIKI